MVGGSAQDLGLRGAAGGATAARWTDIFGAGEGGGVHEGGAARLRGCYEGGGDGAGGGEVGGGLGLHGAAGLVGVGGYWRYELSEVCGEGGNRRNGGVSTLR